MEREKLILGIDIGGTNLRFGLVDEENQLHEYEHYMTQQTFVEGAEPAAKLAEVIRSYCDGHLGGQLPAAVSIGFPSTINRDRTVVIQTPNISVVPDHFRVVEALEEMLGIPVFINRDVNNLIFYDLYSMQIEDYENVCGVYFGTGIGNAVMVNGRILLGRNGVASELGHYSIYGNKRICTCGNEGCVETVVSGVALQRIRDEEFPDIFIGDIFERCGDTETIQNFIKGMAQVVAMEETLFDPECVIVGGGLPTMKGFPKEEFEKLAHYYTRKPYPENNMEIRYSKPEQNNGVIGAAIYARKRMSDPTYL